MPFTLSHTIAVIPIYKYLGKYSAFSALIIGSMTPDFAYLTPRLVYQRVDSHSLIGLYLYDIPMGLTVYFLFHLLMAPVIVSLLPKIIKKKLHHDLFIGKLPNIPAHILVLSLVLGSFTHIFWDFFTHAAGLPKYLDWMNVPLIRIDSYDLMPYRALQHFSTIFGLSILMLLIWRWLERKNNQDKLLKSNKTSPIWQASKKLKIFSIVTLLSIPTALGIYYGLTHLPDTGLMYGIHDAQVFLRFMIVGTAGGFILSSVLLGFLYQYQINREST